MHSPQITHREWGRLIIDGQEYKDAKLWPGGARAWDWNETGTQHEPGIQPADVEELLQHGAQTVILSKGVHERLKTMQATLDLLRERGVSVEVLQTERAVERYNELAAKGEPVGALAHSTC